VVAPLKIAQQCNNGWHRGETWDSTARSLIMGKRLKLEGFIALDHFDMATVR